jgi:hypothetical protein
MTAQVRQNIYAAWLDGDVTAMEALRSLCADYEELDATYKDFEGLREQTREQISNVLARYGDKAEIKGFGVLTLTAPSTVISFDKQKMAALMNELVDEGEEPIADRIAACRTKSARSGGLRIEREKAPR